jgi:SseB protein N-terminal domain
MHSDLLGTLKALPTDPARVVDLYRQLYAGSFIVPVQAGTEADLGTALFLTYPSPDGVRELPVFTSRDYVLANIHPDAVLVTACGNALWPRLRELVRAGQCEVAVDPGQSHGIRLRENMILGIIRSYGG